MKINMPCPDCGEYNYIDLIEQKEISYACNNCKEIRTYLTMPIYPLFFQYGIISYQNGYFFESFISIYKAYETFIRDFVKAALYIRTVQSNDSGNYTEHIHSPEGQTTINRLMKSKFKQSNQLQTAFVTLYFTKYGEMPPKFNSALVTDRNLFVHSDKIITDQDCQKLAKEVKKFIRQVELKMVTESDYFMQEYISGEWISLCHHNSNNEWKSLATQELDLGLGTLDTDYRFESILQKAIEYNHK